MPKYRFLCSTCGADKTQYASTSTLEVACSCGAKMARQLPSSGIQTVTEIVDKFTGVTRDQDHKDSVKERRDQHYWEVEVPRLIDTHSVETCLEQGWLVYNDKGELVINKPPSKR